MNGLKVRQIRLCWRSMSIIKVESQGQFRYQTLKSTVNNAKGISRQCNVILLKSKVNVNYDNKSKSQGQIFESVMWALQNMSLKIISSAVFGIILFFTTNYNIAVDHISLTTNYTN